MRHIKLININRRSFWMHLEVHKVVQGAVHVHLDPHAQGQAHGEVEEGYETHQINQHKQEVVQDVLRSA
jgi:hypothetical protein